MTTTSSYAAAAAATAACAVSVFALYRTRRRLAETLTLAHTCPLTGLANRRRFTTALHAALAEAQPVAVVLIDVDRLKQVNDTHGHATGDQVLVTFARRLAALPIPLAARLSGDEFALLITGHTPAQARAVAEHAWHVLAGEPVATDTGAIAVTASLGLAHHRADMSAGQLLHAADLAMYHAKTTRTRVCTHTGHPPPNHRELPRRRGHRDTT